MLAVGFDHWADTLEVLQPSWQGHTLLASLPASVQPLRTRGQGASLQRTLGLDFYAEDFTAYTAANDHAQRPDVIYRARGRLFYPTRTAFNSGGVDEHLQISMARPRFAYASQLEVKLTGANTIDPVTGNSYPSQTTQTCIVRVIPTADEKIIKLAGADSSQTTMLCFMGLFDAPMPMPSGLHVGGGGIPFTIGGQSGWLRITKRLNDPVPNISFVFGAAFVAVFEVRR
jgi:hypothetical protein